MPVLDDVLGRGGDVPISSLAYDSRLVCEGSLFFCVPGLREDGHDFAAEAVRRGAAALAVERPLGLGIPEVELPCVRSALPLAAARFYRHPSKELRVIGITGTNGKTTAAHMLRAILEAADEPCGLLGTVKSVIAGQDGRSSLTTPEGIEIQRALRAMVDGGDRACVLEVSSHGLKLGRVDAVDFDVAVFTDLSRDHLDFHEHMHDYFLAKRQLLMDRALRPIVNADDPYGRILALRDGAVRFGLSNGDYVANDIYVSGDGVRFTIRGGKSEVRVRGRFHGRHNVANAVGAAAAALELGVDPDTVGRALSDFEGVPGRFERIDEGQPFSVIVDFAHTPAALEQALKTAWELSAGRVICVFGCAGGRDAGTRAPMGTTASRLADVTIVTTDDPRGEDAGTIAQEVRAGMDGREQLILDREEAILHAVTIARPGDTVLIAGRGHERIQRLQGGERTLDDATAARRALSAQTAVGA